MSQKVDDLFNFIKKDINLSRFIQTVIENLAKKVAKGKYNKDLALKAWTNLVNEGARRYNQKFLDGSNSVKWISNEDRLEVAKKLQEDNENAVKFMSERFGSKKEFGFKDSIKVLSSKNNNKIASVSTEEEKAEALFEYLKNEDIISEGDTVEDIHAYDNQNFEYGQYEYIVGNYDECYEWAKEDVKNLYDDLGMESFSESFQEQVMNDPYMFDMDKLKDMMGYDIDDYVNSMDDEEVLNTLETYVDNPEEIDEDNRYEVLRDEMASAYADDPASWYKQYMSDKEFYEFATENGLIDVDKIAESVVDTDGIANSLARYDGEEIYLGNGLYAYRCN